jgi:hypothetical protein
VYTRTRWDLLYYYYGGPLTALRRWPMSRRKQFLSTLYVDDYNNVQTEKAHSLIWREVPSFPRAIYMGEGTGTTSRIVSYWQRHLRRLELNGTTGPRGNPTPIHSQPLALTSEL